MGMPLNILAARLGICNGKAKFPEWNDDENQNEKRECKRSILYCIFSAVGATIFVCGFFWFV